MSKIVNFWHTLIDPVKRLNNKISKETDGCVMIPLFDSLNKNIDLLSNIESNIIEINIYHHDINTFTLYPDKFNKITNEMCNALKTGKLIILNSYVDYDFLLEFTDLLLYSNYIILRLERKYFKYRKKKIIKSNMNKSNKTLEYYNKYKFCKEIRRKLNGK